MKTTILSLMFILATCQALANEKTWNQYESLAKSLASKTAAAPLTELANDAQQLAKISTQLLPAFVKSQPVCSDYINAAIEASDKMFTMSLDDIERDYHADGKLPAMNDAVCYHAKDLLVHPATMVVIGRTQQDSPKTRQMLAHELEEVLVHFGEVKRQVIAE